MSTGPPTTYARDLELEAILDELAGIQAQRDALCVQERGVLAELDVLRCRSLAWRLANGRGFLFGLACGGDVRMPTALSWAQVAFAEHSGPTPPPARTIDRALPPPPPKLRARVRSQPASRCRGVPPTPMPTRPPPRPGGACSQDAQAAGSGEAPRSAPTSSTGPPDWMSLLGDDRRLRTGGKKVLFGLACGGT